MGLIKEAFEIAKGAATEKSKHGAKVMGELPKKDIDLEKLKGEKVSLTNSGSPEKTGEAKDVNESKDVKETKDKPKEAAETKETEGKKDVEQLKTINQDYEGQEHNGVKYERKTVEVDGQKKEGVFPQFESKADVTLPKDLEKASDQEQFKYCTKELKKKIEENPELAKQFTPRQLEQIMNEEPKISGYTWHHSEEPGKMQLVDEKTHNECRHTGGRSVWGGGTANR